MTSTAIRRTNPRWPLDGKPYTTLSYANGPGAVKGERPMPETGPMARQQSLVPTSAETHGGEDVPLYATGPGSQEVHGVIEQNRIHDIVEDALGLRRGASEKVRKNPRAGGIGTRVLHAFVTLGTDRGTEGWQQGGNPPSNRSVRTGIRPQPAFNRMNIGYRIVAGLHRHAVEPLVNGDHPFAGDR